MRRRGFQVRGSTAITGAVWGVWVLKTPRSKQGEEQPKDRWLEINLREGERKTLTIELNPEFNSWTLISSNQPLAPEQASAKDKVTFLLRGFNGKGLELAEIRELLPDVKTKTLQTALNRLVDDSVVGKRPSEMNPKFKVYYMDSPTDSDGFNSEKSTDSTTDSCPKKNGVESVGESNGNLYESTDSGDGFKIATPRG